MSVQEDPLVEAQVQQLQEAGLENAPFDPASFEALKTHIQESTQAGKPLFATTPPSKREATPTQPPLQNVDIYGPPAAAKAAAMAGNHNSENQILLNTPPPNNDNSNQARFFTMGSDLTDPGSSAVAAAAGRPPPPHTSTSNISALSGMGASSAAATSPQAASANTTTESKILEQLRVQTSLILHLQRRVDELSVQVKENKQQQQQQMMQLSLMAPSGGDATRPGAGLDSLLPQQQHQQRAAETTTATDAPTQTSTEAAAARNEPPVPHAAETPPIPPQQQQQPPPAVQLRGLWRWLLVRNNNDNNNPWERIRNSRLAKLYAVYSKMRKQEVQDMQWGVMIKVLVMMSILLGRMVSSSKRHPSHTTDGEESLYANIPTKFYILIAVVILGLLGQTGYLTFLYKFVVKERYPHRVLMEGENVEDILQELEERGRPDPRRRARQRQAGAGAAAADGNNNNNPQGGGGGGDVQGAGGEEGAFDWNGTFLFGGRIAQQQQQQQEGVPPPARGIAASLWDAISDVVYLFGSFFLSIFPMWRPQAQEPPRGGGGAGEPEPEPAQPNNNNNNGDGDNGPGQVRPPVDPAADDD